MPVTKTAKRALRSSRRKQVHNKRITTMLEIAMRKAQKNPTKENIRNAISAADKAAKKGVIHQNKANRLKSQVSSLKS